MSVSAAQLFDLYLAYFGRPPDVAGMRYYLAGDFQLEDVVRGFSASPESVAINGNAFGAAQINAIYQNLFNRDAEPAGQQYWQNEVASGRLTPAAAALGILQGAQNADKASVQNKETVARAFVDQLDTDREMAGYSGADAAALARAYLKTVDSSASSVAAAQTTLAAQVGLASGTAAPSGGGSSPPPPFGVSKDGGNIVSFTTAGAQIGVAEAGGTYTFTSGASTATLTGTVAGYVVPASTTLSLSSVLGSGMVFSGTGTALIVADTAGENLTAFTATGVGGFQLASGQNYTLTAAQAAIGRIGAAGTAGSLTDAGTITVRDTLTALGGGVAATLKANGADSVIANTTAGADISAIAVAGIDSIVLVAGNYTMTAAQAALVDGTTGAQTVTVTTLASGVLTASVESFVLGNFANTVTLGAAAQSVSSPSGTATTLTIAGSAPSGTWALGNTTDDTLVATSGANITGVNGGGATTAEKLTLTGGITMTRDQHEALAITAVGGADSVAITTNNIVTAKSGVETYIVSQAGTANTVSVATTVGGVYITGGTGTTNVVIDAGTTANGNWSLNSAGADDAIGAGNGVNISGVNGGAATTAETLTVNGSISMSQAQHAAFTTVTAIGGSDAITITNGGAVTARADIETYVLSGGGANDITVRAGATIINGAAGNATTVTVGGNTVSGSWSLLNALDTIAVSGGSIAGVNSGASTSAEKLVLTGGVTMTQAQALGLTDVTATGGSDFITITTGGAVTARTGVETYNVSSGGSNTVFVLAATKVAGDSANATTVNVEGNTVTGAYALSNGADVLQTTDGANIAGATTSTVERLSMSGSVTMTMAQYAAFNTGGITAGGSTDSITLTGIHNTGATLNAAIETFVLSAGNNWVTVGANGQTIDAGALASGDTFTVDGSLSAVVKLDAGKLDAQIATGALTVTGGAAANNIVLGSGNDTVNAGDGNDVITNAVSGVAGIDTLNGEDGNDTFVYAAMADFIASNAVVDRIDGGNGTDSVVIAGPIALTTASNLQRMTTVEQLKAQTLPSGTRTHSIVINSDTFLSSLNTIDLSGDTSSTSTATLTFTGVTTAMTLKGVGGSGTNNIAGGSGADTLVGGNGADFFFYADVASFISGTAVVDSIDGGGGTDSISVAGALTVSSAQSLARITNVENLRAEVNAGSARAYSLTFQSDANLGSISKIDLGVDQAAGSTATVNLTGVSRGMTVIGVLDGANTITGGSGADTLSGGKVNDIFRGGAGNDTITTSSAGDATYVFEATASANGSDTLTGVRSGGKFDFSGLLGTRGVSGSTAVDVTIATAGLDLSAGQNIGVRYGSFSLSSSNIMLATSNTVAGEVAVANDGKVVVFSFSGGSTGNSANGAIYYVEDTTAGAGQSWSVTLIGTMSGTSATIAQIASSSVFL